MLLNTSQGVILAERPRVAVRWWMRARGMIGRRFDGFDAFILPRCRSIHTWWMSQPLDLIFVDQAGRVLDFRVGAKPWRWFIGARGTDAVIELPSGRLYGISVQRGDILTW
ncbi:MAG: DUF192 domain-containing protein [Verrucomicrobia bacterium]|nr:DUF192 domain-containing protein [Verrucomicrobiota bacterium]